MLIAAGLLSILYNVYYTGIIFLITAFIPFVMFGLLCYCYGRVRAELVSAVHVANKGASIPVAVRLSNPTIFPVSYMKIYLSYKNSYSGQKFCRTVIVPLDCRTNASVACNLLSEYSGNVEIMLEGIRLYDYMKLFSLKRKLHSQLIVAVLPNYYELQDNDFLRKSIQLFDSDDYSSVKSGDDPSEVFNIREYREGDRLQRIHWKLSSKLDQLMIKEFSFPINCSILLFVNLNISPKEDALPFMDAILECALSISYTLVMQGRQHYISWFDERQGICTRLRVAKESDLFEAVDGLLHTLPGIGQEDVLSAYLAEFPHDQYTDLLVISGEMLNKTTESFSAIKAHNRQMVYVSSLNSETGISGISAEQLKEYGEAGIDLWPVDIGNVRRDLQQFGKVC